MLYRLNNDCAELEPVAFVDFSQHNKLEKHLEDLLASYLAILFEGMPLMPFHQERRRQPEADIYALNEDGDIVVFELKVSTASGMAMDQLFRYVQEAGQWSYAEIARHYRTYPGSDLGETDLARAHQKAFELPAPLSDYQFNSRQHMIVVGSAADDSLIRAVEFWRRKGLSIDFMPYRVYDIAGRQYFEFFSKPYDVHTNPGCIKGVIFDTNRSFDETAAQQMIEKKRIAAYGDRREAVRSLSHGDLVFYSHGGVGIIAAAKVAGKRIQKDGDREWYWDVEFLTEVPKRFDPFPRAMSFQQVRQVTGKGFYWARTQKVPFLTREEAEHLLGEVKKVLAGE